MRQSVCVTDTKQTSRSFAAAVSICVLRTYGWWTDWSSLSICGLSRANWKKDKMQTCDYHIVSDKPARGSIVGSNHPRM